MINYDDLVLCEDCCGDGEVEDIIGYATRDMAIDAGDRSLAGQPIYGYIICPTCNGDGRIPRELAEWL